MGRVNTPILTTAQRQELETGLREGRSHCLRMRCQSILLKSEGCKSKDTGRITGMSDAGVNSRLKRYKSEGMSGLQTKAGRGRKPIIDMASDKASILSAVRADRQRMQTAKAEWEKESDKSVSSNTFKTFLKSLADGISE
jgi:transposase